MKNSTGQLALILMLMLALFLQIEGVIPDIFASTEEPITITREKDGLEFNVIIREKSFTTKDGLIINANIINKSDNPISYFADTKSYGVQGASGMALYSTDGKSEFTDKYNREASKINPDSVLSGELMPGETVNCEFTMLPYSIDQGTKKIAASGDYLMKLWYNRGNEGMIEIEFPVIIVKRFGRMYLRA